MENLISRETKGEYRKQSPEYTKLRYQQKKAESSNDTELAKSITKKLKIISSIDVMNSSFTHVKYVRYSDDFLVSVIGNKALAK